MPEGDDFPNPFGPDAPSVRPGDPKGGQTAPQAPPELSASGMPEGDDFAPDEDGASG
jgi:hypothetical protein